LKINLISRITIRFKKLQKIKFISIFYKKKKRKNLNLVNFSKARINNSNKQKKRFLSKCKQAKRKKVNNLSKIVS